MVTNLSYVYVNKITYKNFHFHKESWVQPATLTPSAAPDLSLLRAPSPLQGQPGAPGAQALYVGRRPSGEDTLPARGLQASLGPPYLPAGCRACPCPRGGPAPPHGSPCHGPGVHGLCVHACVAQGEVGPREPGVVGLDVGPSPSFRALVV